MSEIRTLHEPFASYLRSQGIPFIRARSDRESTIANGCQDFTLLLGGRCLCIEFKAKEGKLSPAQRQWIAAMESAGTRVHVIRDLAAALVLVNAWRSTLGQVLAVDAPRRETMVFGGHRYDVVGGELVNRRPA